MADVRPLRPDPRRTLSEQAILDAALALLAELDGPNAKALGATMLTILDGADLNPAASAHAAHLLNVYILGSVALETDDRAAATDRFRWDLDQLLDGLTAYATQQD